MSDDLQQRAQAILDAAEKMTPGPWDSAEYDTFRSVGPIHIEGGILSDDDRGLLALRNDAPGVIRDLLAENERLRLENEHGWPAVLSMGREKIKRLRLEVERLRADATPTWLDAPDGTGRWWRYITEGHECGLTCVTVSDRDVKYYRERDQSRHVPELWCRAIAPSLPDKEGET